MNIATIWAHCSWTVLLKGGRLSSAKGIERSSDKTGDGGSMPVFIALLSFLFALTPWIIVMIWVQETTAAMSQGVRDDRQDKTDFPLRR
jgi:hypothetical protein